MTAQIEPRSREANHVLPDQNRDLQHHSLRHMQSRNLISMVFDNTLLGLKICFDKFAEAMAVLMAGILTPKQARSVSIYLTAFLVAILMLAFCRELNMSCFRTAAKNDCTSASRLNSDDSMPSNTSRNSVL
ncbi:MAG TPA: hypothetical protein V6C89_09875 [Drouetiella sp.]|jgi:hypothetical protein